MPDNKYNELTPEEEAILIHRGTEPPFTGFYTDYGEKGLYTCKRCGAPLFRSEYKFHSGCGWPSFDSQIDGAIEEHPDPDGRRTEIVCSSCGAHMGHVFRGEAFTERNTRHCVNSLSMNFIGESETETAIFAGGCFWGVQHYFRNLDGVFTTRVGYTGGTKENPTYREVCSHDTGHYEAIEVLFDPRKISYEELAKLFFEIHNPEQRNGQGPDIGEQYMSALFYGNDSQRATGEKLIEILRGKGLDVATEILPAETFWEAEDYHQNYYAKKGSQPYCHFRTKRF